VARVATGATRAEAQSHFIRAIGHYVYAGDTALHVAAAAYQPDVARRLLDLGAKIDAASRRKAQPLHYAADGAPGSAHWNPGAQAATIRLLIERGADPNAQDMNGVRPLHRAVRTRCSAAVGALLEAGADVRLTNGNGSTVLQLARRQTGRGGSGSPEARTEQRVILDLLERYLAPA